MNRIIRIVTDNIGLSYRNGHSTCLLTQTVSKAIYSVSSAFNAQVEIVHKPRCSDSFSTAADSLSKQRPWEAAEMVGGRLEGGARRRLQNPRLLGQGSSSGEVPGN